MQSYLYQHFSLVPAFEQAGESLGELIKPLQGGFFILCYIKNSFLAIFLYMEFDCSYYSWKFVKQKG